MIESPGDTFFPYNAIEALENGTRAYIDPTLTFERRRLLVTDPNDTVGIVPISWNPAAGEIGRVESSIQLYTIYIQTLIVDPDEARGLQTHSYFAKRMREMLVRNPVLRVALGKLETVDPAGVKEKTSNVTVGEQVFHNQETDGNWRYLSTLELRLETQISN
ncbi:hypothetical protein SEA_GOURDTHYMES_21 [Gordonia phage GourdThymes]|uniref:Tail terminator n=14 Tax=Montyvirus TaxID=2733196 RepID=A0A2L1IV94_9CAUD|nr:hypothetical protein BH763_gp020 [Gordonia phage Monty]YP_009300972.1 hypothetical protein BJD64_gp021 [Gordonia phage Hotorobo]YP_009795601.1 head-to-tail connector protein [Gordonia phage BirksAndSocks]YP_009797864.1 hypothetical protein HOS74_gp021 [Gordonia phage Flakey]YP_009836989.1 head-to-tail connector protein [Gordonia phage Adgers]YP_009843015.1 hypothetical protein HWC02_gp021 [Gordonia phage Sombrero]YP_009848302.1 hypothetical protein HWC39_gp021 [Gordonia phage Beaver]YP_00